MTVAFRNVNASPSDPVATWPYEAIVTVIERGLVPDWRPVLTEMRARPHGRVARMVEAYLDQAKVDGATALFRLVLDDARLREDDLDRAEAAARVRDCITRSGLSAAAFARELGTSASRLSTYANGRVTPSAALMVRMERVAARGG